MRTIKPVKVGDCLLDGKHIYIQSMLNRRSDDIAGSVEQALALEQAGCEIVRAAIPDMDAVRGQLRFSGKGAFSKVRSTYSGGAGGKRTGACGDPEPVRF